MLSGLQQNLLCQKKLTVAVLKVAGETNTDDLSPASEAFTRSDIPLHANAMLVKRLPGSIEKIKELIAKGYEVAYVGDVVGTGSRRKSGINSIQWFMGREIPNVPNKKTGGLILGSTIAPIFFNTAEDSGAPPIEVNVEGLETGDIIVYPLAGKIEKNGKVVATFKLSPNTLADEYRAGGRIPLIIGRGLTTKARASLGMGAENIFAKPEQPEEQKGVGYTLAQKMVGRACGVEGVRAGMYVEPHTLTVGSQDTTGPMTRDEIKELAALGFSADLVMQSFCHTAAYPKPSDVKLHHTLPSFITSRSGVSLRAGDGVIHSWLNRMVLPDTVEQEAIAIHVSLLVSRSLLVLDLLRLRRLQEVCLLICQNLFWYVLKAKCNQVSHFSRLSKCDSILCHQTRATDCS